MPIEIRELLIRVTIQDTRKRNRDDAMQLTDIKSSIVKECTQKVLVKLNRQKTR